MSRFEQVRNDVWNDAPFCDLSPPAKLLYLWSFINPACSMSGVYKIRPEVIALDTGLATDTITAVLAELEAHDMVCFEDGVMWVRARVQHLKAGGPNLAKSIARDVAALTVEHPIRVAFLARYGTFAWLRDWLRPLVVEGVDQGLARGSEAPCDFPVVEGNSEAPLEPLPRGPLHLHLHGSSSRSKQDAGRARIAEHEVWEHYLDVFHPDRRGRLPDFNEKRRKVVTAALAVHDVATCKLAITGLSKSPYHNGENEQGIKYLDIRHALRGNGQRAESHEERIERMAALVAARPRRPGERPNLTSAQLMAAEAVRS